MSKLLPWMRIAVAVCTLGVLLALGLACVGLYLEGNSSANLDANGVHLTPVYSVEKVSERLRPMAPVLLGYAALVLLALTAQALADGPAASRSALSLENRLRLLKARVASLPDAARSEERRRRMMAALAAFAVLICAGFSLVYLLNGAHFISWNLETVMGDMLWHVAPWVIVGFGVMIAASLAFGRSVERELALLREVPKTAPKKAPEGRRVPLTPLRAALYIIAIVFIVLGVMNGGLRDVLVKAINICTECIGLG